MAQEACNIMPQTRLQLQENLGHLAHEEDPAGTAALILNVCGVATERQASFG
jgi:magnesium chelatase accessory protein